MLFGKKSKPRPRSTWWDVWFYVGHVHREWQDKSKFPFSFSFKINADSLQAAARLAWVELRRITGPDFCTRYEIERISRET